MTTAANEAVPTGEDDFASAFEEAVVATMAPDAGEAKPDPVTPDPKPVVAEVKPVVVAPVVPDPKPATPDPKPVVVADPATPDPATTEVKPAAPDPAAEAEAKRVADQEAADKVSRENAEKLAREAADRIARETADKKVADDKAATDAAAAELKDPVITADDQKIIDKFSTEWADVRPAVDIMLKHAIAQTEVRVARTFQKVLDQIYKDIAPLAESVGSVATRSLRQSVLEAHSDYDAIYPKLEGWIKTQPAYLANAMQRVYTEGNADEISDLVKRYKEANGVKPEVQSTSQQSTESVTPVTTAKPNAAAAAALAPVTGKRTAPVPKGVDDQDYDSAFEEAAAAMK